MFYSFHLLTHFFQITNTVFLKQIQIVIMLNINNKSNESIKKIKQQ